jgi:DNA invertase Pin-like site-specific DNA recombinase
MRYAVYLRVSTDQQADTGGGLEIQEQECRRWLRRNGHRLAEVCVDAGRSGGAELAERPGLVRALGLVQDDQADGVLVYRLDRLARDIVLQEQLLAQLHRRGKELHSCSATEDEHLVHAPGDPQRALVRQILGAIAQYEREVIRLRLVAGLERKKLAGGFTGGGVPYGYESRHGELVPVPAEQEAVRLICTLHRQGRSYRSIAEALESRGIRSHAPSGNWRPNTIRAIVLREGAKKATVKNVAAPLPQLDEVSA